MSMSAQLQQAPIISKNNVLGLIAVNGTRNDKGVLEKIATTARLNRCSKCKCLRTRHDLVTGICKDCGCVKPRKGNVKRGRDMAGLYDMEAGQ